MKRKRFTEEQIISILKDVESGGDVVQERIDTALGDRSALYDQEVEEQRRWERKLESDLRGKMAQWIGWLRRSWDEPRGQWVKVSARSMESFERNFKIWKAETEESDRRPTWGGLRPE